MKALIAMSGGVDSSVAACLMQRGGYDCAGVTLSLYNNETLNGLTSDKPRRGCCSLKDFNDAKDAAYKLGMPHYVLNFREVFEEEVIRRFVESYEAGLTPNPCIDCNRFIKFNTLLFRARQLDFDYLATGHYGRVEEAGGRFLLKKALDSGKDQSYVLYGCTQEQLSQLKFPLGELTKAQVREIAREQGFDNADKPDSQDICFVPSGDYGAFIESYRGRPYPEGDIIDGEGRVLGKHRGQIRYTLGQRRGLGVAMNDPVYVCAKSAEDNTVTLGPESSLYQQELRAGKINLIACDSLEQPTRVMVKTRYLQKEQGALATQTGADTIHIRFDEPQRALTPGQAAVMYDGDTVIGGGTILGSV